MFKYMSDIVGIFIIDVTTLPNEITYLHIISTTLYRHFKFQWLYQKIINFVYIKDTYNNSKFFIYQMLI